MSNRTLLGLAIEAREFLIVVQVRLASTTAMTVGYVLSVVLWLLVQPLSDSLTAKLVGWMGLL
jgi:hypothetical protein